MLATKSTLLSLSSEAFSCILSLLDSIDMCSLLGCGNRLLTAKMERDLETLHCEALVAAPLPLSLLQAPRLRSVRIVGYQHYDVALRVDKTALGNARGGPRLQTLEFGFQQSFHLLVGFGEPMSLRFPALTSLTITHFPLEEDLEAAMAALPPQLKSLRLTCLKGHQSSSIYPITVIQGVPRTLEELSLECCELELPTTVEIENGALSDLWPPQLHTLRLNHIENWSLVPLIPKTLTDVNIRVDKERAGINWRVSSLPPNVVSLVVYNGSSVGSKFIHDAPFPASLTRMKVSARGDWVDEIHRLPPSLTYIGPIHYKMFRDSSQPTLFSHLQDLKSTSISKEEHLEILPKTLTKLIIMTPLHRISKLPKTLKSLRVENLEPQCFKEIPDGLDKLFLWVDQDQLNREMLLSTSHLESIPTSITVLDLDLPLLNPSTDLKPLKRLVNLRELLLGSVTEFQFNMEEGFLTDCLVPTIEFLIVSAVHGAPKVSSAWWKLASLRKQVPRLQKLFIEVELLDTEEIEPLIRDLPPNLRYLTLDSTIAALSPQAMRYLPKHLSNLSLSTQEDAPIDEELIQQLKLPGVNWQLYDPSNNPGGPV